MIRRRSFSGLSFSPLAFAFELFDDGQEEVRRGASLSAAHLFALPLPKIRDKKKRLREEFAMMAL